MQRGSHDAFGLREFLLIVLGLLATGALAAANLPAPNGQAPFAVVFPPWTSAGEAADLSLSAGFRVLRAGAVPFVTIVAAGLDETPSGVAPRSALMMIPFSGLAGCGTTAPDGLAT